AEVAGLSMSVQLTQVPRDSANETHSEWRIDFTGVGGRRCTLKWYAIRGWAASRVVYEHHYGHEQIGGPLTQDDLNFKWGRAEGNFVIVHGRFSAFGAPVNWIAADILRIEDGLLVEHWDVIQDEATEEQSKSGAPMFGKTFPKYK